MSHDSRPDGLRLGSFVTPASFSQPELITNSTWLSHASFAFWLVDAMRPQLTVELGVYKGFSYFVFCAAAEAAGTGVCVGVDTWEGDEQSGAYDDEIYKSARAANERYADRSTLLRMTFDEALGEIEPGSIDVLHIDGCHRYDDVRHDFESWLDRMSPQGVVLFHDTRVRRDAFGVWRLWEEVASRYPSFEFSHGHGLGILAVGEAVPSPVADLCRIDPASSLAEEIDLAYGSLGARFGLELAVSDLDARRRSLATLEEELLAVRERESAEIRALLAESLDELQELHAELTEVSMDAYAARWEKNRLAARLALVGGTVEVGPSVLRVAAAASKFLREHPSAARTARALTSAGRRRRPAEPSGGGYRDWIHRFDTVAEPELGQVEALAARLEPQLVSIVLPVCGPSPHLEQAVASVEGQIHRGWELIVVDDRSDDPSVRRALAALEQRDPRINVVHRSSPGGVSAALNSGLERARGELAIFLEVDGALTSDALLLAASAFDREPGTAFAYSDEDRLDGAGRRFDPYFKPDWNPSLLLGQNYVGRLLICRRELVESVGGFRSEFDAVHDWDLILRMAEQVGPEAIAHIPFVLHHSRHDESSPSATRVSGGRRVVEEALARRGVAAAPMSRWNGWNRIVYELPTKPPTVNVVVPTGLAHPFVRLSLESVLRKTTYPAFTVTLVLDQRSLDARGHRLPSATREDERVEIVTHSDERFNFSRAVNLGVAVRDSELVCLLNDDVVVDDPGWLTALVARTLQPGVGAAGALLVYPDNTIQHGGVILGLGDAAFHYHEGLPVGEPGYHGRALLDQELSCVTAACMVVRRDVYQALGGFDESFEVAFNDVDFCLRLRELGWRIVWTPEARLFHAESTSVREVEGRPSQYQEEVRRMRARWEETLAADPYYSPNLSLAVMNGLAWPPRVTSPTRPRG